ncbi:MAG TPA: SgcJ/EcaC family oxidoreductase, partial [Gemmataceae bacterium]
MRRNLLLLVVIIGLSAIASQAVQSQSESKKQATQAEPADTDDGKTGGKDKHAADEAAIRANIEAFVKAYNASDAKAIAALFTPDGQLEDKDGDQTEGREAIAKAFADIFKESPKKQIKVIVDTIRFIGNDLAVEVGTTEETPAPNEPPEYDRYTVLHVKRDGKWQMAFARDEEGPVATAHERLLPLAWLVGDWIDDGGSTVVNSTCRWSEDGNFLLQEFKVKVNGRDSMNISQRIGWDPLAKRIRSWVFDSAGGFGESVWTSDDNSWLIKATAVRPDGTAASATNLLVPSGKDAYVWRSTDRVVGDDVEEPVEV